MVQNVATEICEKLPHTPISGLGHNFTFLLDQDENFTINNTDFDGKIRDRLPVGLSNTLNEKVSSLHRYSLSFNDQQYKLNLQYEQVSETSKILNFNFHYDLNEIQDLKMKDIASSYIDNQKLALQMLKTLTIK